MTTNDAVRLREQYLTRLDEAMREVPHGIAADIRRGILEEFDGLDAEGATRLIDRLGEPEVIAAEAMPDAAAGAPVIVVAPPAPRGPVTATRGFAIVAALAIGFGGIVVPVIGWVIGAVLVCLSPLWRTAEKVFAIAMPAVGVVLAWVLVHLIHGPGLLGEDSGGVHAPGVNPLIPAAYDLTLSTVLVLLLVVVPASGLWLLWRLRGREAARP